ncbi:L-histidine N(alpha)-methyltransferase [Methylobacterium sp. ID0610]|uniref:L-histidine N(alpha)-methyltransferase n=1 Tax=Methylobacterium carpenticola TaxID=3344827 RepID=UPI0036C6E461
MSSTTAPPREPSEAAAFLRDALASLSAEPRALPGKYLWDVKGSTLFDRICGSRDYYPTGREMALLPAVATAVAARIGANATVVEYGSGASRKIRVLLDALRQPKRYIALDISWEFLLGAINHLAQDYPSVEMIPVHADYSQPITLPVDLAGDRVLGFFPGTSISNFSPDQAIGFMERVRATLGPSWFLIGVDPTRDEDRLLRAYGGSDGLMAALHLNLLARANREIGATFDLDAFRHEARVRSDPFRVEAHLVATRATECRLGGRIFRFEPGGSIHTDNSYKYKPEEFQEIARRSGWIPHDVWLDEHGVFSLHLLRSA